MFCFVSWKGAYSSIATVDVHVQAEWLLASMHGRYRAEEMRKRWLVNEEGNMKCWLHGICGSVQLRMLLFLKNVYHF